MTIRMRTQLRLLRRMMDEYEDDDDNEYEDYEDEYEEKEHVGDVEEDEDNEEEEEYLDEEDENKDEEQGKRKMNTRTIIMRTNMTGTNLRRRSLHFKRIIISQQP